MMQIKLTCLPSAVAVTVARWWQSDPVWMWL